MHLPGDSDISFLDIYPGEMKAYIYSNSYSQIFVAVLSVIVQLLETKQSKPKARLDE